VHVSTCRARVEIVLGYDSIPRILRNVRAQIVIVHVLGVVHETPLSSTFSKMS
jgi:hypothetical protein